MPTGGQEGVQVTLDATRRSNESNKCAQCSPRRLTYLIIGGVVLFVVGLAMIIVYRQKLNAPETSTVLREPQNPLGVTAIVFLVIGVIMVFSGRIGYIMRKYCNGCSEPEGTIEDEESILPSERIVQITTSSYVRNISVSRSSRVNSEPINFTPPPSYTTIYPEPPPWLINGETSIRTSVSTNCDREDFEPKQLKEFNQRNIDEEPPPSYSGLFPD